MELAKNFDHKSAEQKWYQHWLDKNYFASTPDNREPYTIVMPPPNVTGVLHMGHALNNTIQESWECEPDSDAQWSHCAVVPLYVLFEDLIGLRPLTPGYQTYEIRPQLAEAPAFEAVAHTPVGPVRVKTMPTADGCEVRLTAACWMVVARAP